MKKVFFAFVISSVLFSCKKDKCWIYTDCAGNDVGTSCGSEKDAKSYCAANGTTACPPYLQKTVI